jgi:hypothetical protein
MPQVPEVHLDAPLPPLGSAQSTQPLPQCSGSVLMLKHSVVEPHLAYPALQLNPQLPPLQVELASAGGVQTVPQLPQFCGSVWVLTH